MKQTDFTEKLYLILRIVLGVIFLYASWDKILDPKGFVRVVQNYAILPPVLENFTAIALPWVEAVCGILLISGYFVKGSAFIVDMLMLLFILTFAFNIYRGVDVACGCFSNKVEAGKGDYFWNISRDVLILCMGLWVLFYKIKTERIKIS